MFQFGKRSMIITGVGCIVALGLLAYGVQNRRDIPRFLSKRISIEQEACEKVAQAPRADYTAASGLGSTLLAMQASEKHIRTATLAVEVPAYDEAFQTLQRIVAEQGGYIANISAHKGMSEGQILVRVPPEKTFATLDALRGLGRVTQEGVSTQDISREYADLEARIAHKRAVEGRMREIFRTHTATLENLLRMEQELSNIHGEIERMEAERRYYQQMTAHSSITIQLREGAAPLKPASPSFFAPLAAGAQEGGAALISLLGACTYGLILGAPFLLAGWLVWRTLRRRRPATQEA